MFQDERERILEAYDQRKQRGLSTLYHWSKPDVLVSHFSRQWAAAKLLNKAALGDLHDLKILDVGCGSGQWLMQLMQWGAQPENLHGIDLLEDRVIQAQKYLPASSIALTEGWPFPFESQAFDLICANTVISSIHDSAARQKFADEMVRVCRHEGAILIYDFQYAKPGSTDTIAVTKREMQKLFSNCSLSTQSLTLAPPICRKVAPWSTTLAILLETVLSPLRTHVMYLITPTTAK